MEFFYEKKNNKYTRVSINKSERLNGLLKVRKWELEKEKSELTGPSVRH
jgi:hypothetical protein